jgi:hypothetical protein
MSLYLMGVYCGCAERPGGETADARWFRDAWGRTGKKLDMGKACVRFRTLEGVALDVVGEAIRRIPARLYVARYQETLAGKDGATRAEPAATARRPAAKKRTGR